MDEIRIEEEKTGIKVEEERTAVNIEAVKDDGDTIVITDAKDDAEFRAMRQKEIKQAAKDRQRIQSRLDRHGRAIKPFLTTGKFWLSVIGLIIMFGGGFLPAPEPITHAGMVMIGVFVGLVFLWTAVDLIWPLFPAMVIFGVVYKDLFPASWQSAGIYEATQQSFGNWITVFIMLCLVLCVALYQSGLIRRIALWFLSTKFARRGPKTFTIMIMFTTMFIGWFLDATPTQAFMLSIAYELFEEIGYKPGDAWPKKIVMAITCASAVGYAMTPICHVIPLLVLGILGNITGMTVNFIAYMFAAFPIGLVIFVLLCIWVTFFVKADTTKLEAYDMDRIKDIRPGPMVKREKWVAGVSIALVFLWVFPGILTFAAPSSAISQFFSQHTSLMPLVLGVGFLGFMHVDGKPLLDLGKAFQNINWQPVILLAGIMMSSAGLSAAGAGVTDFIKVKLFPLISGFSPWMLVAMIAILSCLLTNVLSNSAVGAVFITAGLALATEMNINPMYIGVAVCFGANMAFLFPSSFVPVSVAYASPWCGGKTMLKNGAVIMVMACIVMALMIYPMSMLVYGA